MSIKSIDQKFTSNNSVPVERAVVTREEWEAVSNILKVQNIALKDMLDVFGSSAVQDMTYTGAIDGAEDALTQYKEAKQ